MWVPKTSNRISSSDYEGVEAIHQPCLQSSSNVALPSMLVTTFCITLPSPASSSFSRPTLPPNPHSSLIVLQYLRKLRNEFVHINFDVIEYHKFMFLLATCNGDVLFELPPCWGSTSGAKGMEAMDKRYNDHTWCRITTSNIHNDVGFKFRKSHCVGYLICENTNYDYRTRSSKSNETKWIGITNR